MTKDEALQPIDVYYRVGDRCWIHITTSSPQSSQSIKQFQLLHEKIGGCLSMTGEEILKVSPEISVAPKKAYIVYQKESITAIQASPRTSLGLWQTKSYDTLIYRAELETERYRRKKWQSFLDEIYNDSTNTEQVLVAGMSHTLCDHYSLWFYNEQAQIFHLHSSSFETEATSIEFEEKNNALSDFIRSKKIWEFSSPKGGAINSQALRQMKSINRFKIDVGFPAILSYYSAIENYQFNQRAKKIIPEILQSKLHEEIFPTYVKKSLRLKDITSQYKLGRFDEFLEDVLHQVTKDLGWEAASIFLEDKEKQSLTLRALVSSGQQQESKPISAEYPINCNSLTSMVFRENRPATIYDINTHQNNSHIFNEKTLSSPRNWVGVPIGRSQQQPIGVLRTKNRIERNRPIDPNVLDIKLLEAISSNIAYLYDLNSLYEKRRRDTQESLQEIEKENKNLNEFIKTFRHELKSPLTILTQASNTIQRRLIKEGLISKEQLLPRKLQLALDDLDSVGSRLALVTNYLTFDAHELVREIKRSKVYNEIVAPVTTFASGYAKDKGTYLNVSLDSLARYNAICDPGSVGMAFHMILDNAIKYSDEGAPIQISGNITNEFIGIRISSNSIEIREDEAQNIFDKYFRGEEARNQKIEGSGIGLYLARQILVLNGGDILLVKRSNPVTFEIRLKSLNA
jgi:signal transduction histidine kinase